MTKLKSANRRKHSGKVADAMRAAAKRMPPLRHSIPGEPFDIMKSEACAWLLNQPDVRNWVWDRIKDNSAISYDPESGTWSGSV
ncbi:hypothetical protein [Faecalibaculum rodentium]|uniref:hypothetical protein n=1 Tax=Faecalibaculum rodentium TaxID=1702221 RepID=UPI003EBB0819